MTGFGLFRNYKVNSSWESVKRLKLKGVNLIIKEIPVAYEDVDRYVSQIWSNYKPLVFDISFTENVLFDAMIN